MHPILCTWQYIAKIIKQNRLKISKSIVSVWSLNARSDSRKTVYIYKNKLRALYPRQNIHKVFKKATKIVQVYSLALVSGCETRISYNPFDLCSLFCGNASYPRSERDTISANCLSKTLSYFWYSVQQFQTM